MSESESRPVVVGVDGSVASLAALRRAVEDAGRRGDGMAPRLWPMIGPLSPEVFADLSPQSMKTAAQEVLDRGSGEHRGCRDLPDPG